ncbi:hypothetical protein ACFYPT_38945 [Streptomyces sp. NPDC005529]|uniref:hypothetical protein n=1 Tax=unclassified Streptomyces TaxID=2593676 RepID=UPI0033B198C7
MSQCPLIQEASSAGLASKTSKARDHVDRLDRQLPRAQLSSPADELDGLAGAGIVEVPEGGGLEATDLVSVVGTVAGVVVQRDVHPGWLPDLRIQAAVVPLRFAVDRDRLQFRRLVRLR